MTIKIYKGLLKLKKVGTSSGIIISKNIRNSINILEGEYIGIKLWKIYPKEFVCDKCNKTFMDYEHSEIHDCPHCGDEFKKLKGGNEVKMSEEKEIEEKTKEQVEEVCEVEEKVEEQEEVVDEENSEDEKKDE